MRLTPLFAAALLLAGCSAHASAFARAKTGYDLPASDGWEEVNLCLRVGETIDYTWSSTATLSFDIHTHANGIVKEWVSEKSTHGSGHFTATKADIYSPFWENTGGTNAKLDYTVTSNGGEYHRGQACPA